MDGSGNVYIADTYNNAIKEWSAATGQVTTLLASGLNEPTGVAVDGAGNVYIADNLNQAIKEIPNVFVGPATVTEAATAGSDALLPVVPSTTSLTGFFAPTSDQSWLTVGTITNDAIGFSFSANPAPSPRVAHISVLGQQITIGQNFTTTAEFADVPPSAAYFDAANLMFLAGVTTGCVTSSDPSTRMYCPNDSVTREEMAAFIVRAVTGTMTPAIYNPVPLFHGCADHESVLPAHPEDGGAGHYDRLRNRAILPNGHHPALGDGDLHGACPAGAVWGRFSYNGTPYFADVPTNVEGNASPFPFIQRSYEENITTGCGTNPLIYCPDDLVTRGEMASFIMRALFNQTTILGPTAPQVDGRGSEHDGCDDRALKSR